MTTIAQEITRLQTAKADLKTSLEEKGVTVDSAATLDSYDDYVDEIETGTDTSDATLNDPKHLFEGDTAYADGVKYTGTMSNHGEVNIYPRSTLQEFTEGYYKKVWVQGVPIEHLDVTPTTSAQTLGPSVQGKYITQVNVDAVTSSIDSNIAAGNIKKDVSILGVTGTYTGSAPSGTINISTNGDVDVADYAIAHVDVHAAAEPEEKDVNFYDYTGVRLLSYSKEDFLELEDWPACPTGYPLLTFDGWNFATFTKAKEFVEFYGFANFGAQYRTKDGTCKLHITLPETHLSPYVCVSAQDKNNPVSIDWGDGSTPTDVPYNTSPKSFGHTYEQAGDYIISISGRFGIYYSSSSSGGGEGSDILWGGATHNYNNPVYRDAIKEINMSTGFNTQIDGAFQGLHALKYISFPDYGNLSYNMIKNAFYSCYSLQCVVIPAKCSTLGYMTFANCSALTRVIGHHILYYQSSGGIYGSYSTPYSSCYNLKTIAFPSCYNSTYSSVTEKQSFTTVSNLLQSCPLITKIYMPDTTTISVALFGGSYYRTLKLIDFTRNTAVPTLSNSSAFTACTSDYEIIVPASLYNDWIAATNWSTISSHIVPDGPVPYTPTTEESETINTILGEDTSDPVTPDLTEEEVNDALDNIIGSNE